MARGVARTAAALAAAMTLSPGAARAQPLRRSPVERETLAQLAYVLGEAHALHRLCTGPADGLWYGRMQGLERREAADEGFRRRLVSRFNAGFTDRQAQFPDCDDASRAALRRVAAEGAALARQLATGAETPSPAQ